VPRNESVRLLPAPAPCHDEGLPIATATATTSPGRMGVFKRLVSRHLPVSMEKREPPE
jgi:hypothetical protein